MTALRTRTPIAVQDEVRDALDRGRAGLLALQRPDGHWVGELEGDTILESEFILLAAFLGDDPRIPKLANYLRGKQLESGGWPNYPGGPAEISVSVKAYFALKIAGDAAHEPHMRRAAEAIRALGGAAACNSFTRFYLALLGQIPYANCPTVPPQLILLPGWFPLNVYAMSAWSRTIVVPLSLVSACKPVRHLPAERGIAELFLESPAKPWRPARRPRFFSWANLFLKIDAGLKLAERCGLSPFRERAVHACLAWMRERFSDSDGLGAIFPPMVYTLIALRCLGVPDRAPEVRWARQRLDELMIDEGDALRLQPCLSPVWDTALSLIAVRGAGQAADSPEVYKAANWLLAKEVSAPGDWCRRVPGVVPAGWFFEYRNGHYPDTDDTSMVLMALHRTGRGLHPACARAVAWLAAMQNSDGGWAAFDKDVNNELFTQVPFADHNAMLDPSCPDITARILESLAPFGYGVGHPAVDKAVRFVLGRQESHGGWFGRWGVNYVYGTWQVLVGLAAVGFDMQSIPVRRAVRWLKVVQNADGGWGESCASYDDPTLAGVGPSTASQTAWALLGLMAAGEAETAEVRGGIDYLLGTQQPDGLWTEEPFTGTGFPRVFYLKYHLYPAYFPTMALARFAESGRTNH